MPFSLHHADLAIHAYAGIDFFGTNADLLRDLTGYDTQDGQAMTADDFSSEEDSDPYGFEDADIGPSSAAAAVEGSEGATCSHVIPADARKKMDEQAAYIEALEETNLKLQERIYLLEQDLKHLRNAGQQQAVGGSSRSRAAAAEAGDCSDGDGMAVRGTSDDDVVDEEEEGGDDGRSAARGVSPSSSDGPVVEAVAIAASGSQ